MLLIKRCNALDEELAQAKKKTNTDTGVIEYLRKQVSELVSCYALSISALAHTNVCLVHPPIVCL